MQKGKTNVINNTLNAYTVFSDGFWPGRQDDRAPYLILIERKIFILFRKCMNNSNIIKIGSSKIITYIFLNVLFPAPRRPKQSKSQCIVIINRSTAAVFFGTFQPKVFIDFRTIHKHVEYYF